MDKEGGGKEGSGQGVLDKERGGQGRVWSSKGEDKEGGVGQGGGGGGQRGGWTWKGMDKDGGGQDGVTDIQNSLRVYAVR